MKRGGALETRPLPFSPYELGFATVSENEHFPPPTVYVYVPAASVAPSATALGPLAVAPFDSASVIEVHFVKESLADVTPEPIMMLKLRVGLPGLSEPEMVTVCVVGAGEGVGAGAADTGAVAAEAPVDDPALFAAVTVTRSVEPTSADCTA